jgi:hypothetical protein
VEPARESIVASRRRPCRDDPRGTLQPSLTWAAASLKTCDEPRGPGAGRNIEVPGRQPMCAAPWKVVSCGRVRRGAARRAPRRRVRADLEVAQCASVPHPGRRPGMMRLENPRLSRRRLPSPPPTAAAERKGKPSFFLRVEEPLRSQTPRRSQHKYLPSLPSFLNVRNHDPTPRCSRKKQTCMCAFCTVGRSWTCCRATEDPPLHSFDPLQ